MLLMETIVKCRFKSKKTTIYAHSIIQKWKMQKKRILLSGVSVCVCDFYLMFMVLGCQFVNSFYLKCFFLLF